MSSVRFVFLVPGRPQKQREIVCGELAALQNMFVYI